MPAYPAPSGSTCGSAGRVEGAEAVRDVARAVDAAGDAARRAGTAGEIAGDMRPGQRVFSEAVEDPDVWEAGVRDAVRNADGELEDLTGAERLADEVTEGAGDVFKSTPELENHIQHIDTSVPRNRGIGGAHNSKEFFKNDVKIVKAVPSEDIPGVTYYQYNIPKLGKDGWPVGEYGTKIFEKTVYDPSVISDSEYTQRGLEAASNSYKTNGLLGSVWEGYDSQGVKWIGYGKNGKPTSFFPDVPKP